MRVLLAVDGSTSGLTADDRVLAAAITDRGLDPVPYRWGEPVDPEAVVVIRSTWDYVERPTAFSAWLDHLEAQQTSVLNPVEILRWNMHKRYLLDLERRGVPIVPTALVERGEQHQLEELRSLRGWDEVVVKPAVGGTARLTLHSGRVGLDAAGEHLRRLAVAEDVLVQPAVASVASRGEVSVVAIGGAPLAAFRKQPAPGEWRVQSDFGGTTVRIELDDELVDVAQTATQGRRTDYARVDVVHHEGRWAVLELELVEPELFFLLEPSLAERLAERIEGRIEGRIADRFRHEG